MSNAKFDLDRGSKSSFIKKHMLNTRWCKFT